MQAIAATVKDVFNVDVAIELTRPDEQFGDYATSVALQLSKQLGKNPHEVAEMLSAKLRTELSDRVADISVAGPGFLNLTVADHVLVQAVDSVSSAMPSEYTGKSVVLEYSDPNPFKVLHAGHLYQTVFGEAVANLLVSAGAEVHRVNFGGDVGLHVGKTMWAIVRELGGENPEGLGEVPAQGRSEWMAKCYVQGTNAYEEDETHKQQIIELNKRVYQIVAEGDHDSPLAQIYWTCRQWSYDYFDEFYASVGTHFERYYPESETAPLGIAAVKEQLENGVYEKSDGAIVFKGEPYGLHTRVFINSHGLPTYEAKDVGLSLAKWRDYHFDQTIIITGNDIVEYMKVVLKSIEQFEPELVARTAHLTHGQVKLRGGVKMSSRKGNFLRAVDVLDMVATASKEITGRENRDSVLGAVKYAFLKQRIGPDIIFDPEESVAIEGNSGPYLQYAHARARSILAKVDEHQAVAVKELNADERSLMRKITEYPEVVQKATTELMPHHLCTYLYELAQKFNSFYEHNRVIGDERQDTRLRLVEYYADTLKNGLALLGIAAPGKM